jgi:prefoldin subunit 1
LAAGVFLHNFASLTLVLQLLQEIEARAISSQQQIGVTKAQITAKQKNVRLLELTSKEIGSLSKDTKVYEGVGKM